MFSDKFYFRLPCPLCGGCANQSSSDETQGLNQEGWGIVCCIWYFRKLWLSVRELHGVQASPADLFTLRRRYRCYTSPCVGAVSPFLYAASPFLYAIIAVVYTFVYFCNYQQCGPHPRIGFRKQIFGRSLSASILLQQSFCGGTCVDCPSKSLDRRMDMNCFFYSLVFFSPSMKSLLHPRPSLFLSLGSTLGAKGLYSSAKGGAKG